jgi:hypothetical protein
VQTGSSPNPEKYYQQEEKFIHVPFCRDPMKVSSGKFSLQQERQRKLRNHNNVYELRLCPQYRNLKSYDYKKTEVYNPGKARRLEVRI